MARPVNEGTREHYQQVAVPLANFWRIQRTDGVVHRLTDHDRPVKLAFDDVYTPIDAASGSAVRHDAQQAASADIYAILSTSEIDPADVGQGRLADATVTWYLANWRTGGYPTAATTDVYRVGRVRANDLGATVEILGIVDRMQRTIGSVVQRECRHELYEGICGNGLTRADWQEPGFIVASTSILSRLEFDAACPQFGSLTHIIGPNHRVQTVGAHGLTGSKHKVRLDGATFTGTDPNGRHFASVIDTTTLELPVTGTTSASGGTLTFAADAGWYDHGNATWTDPTDGNGNLTGKVRDSGAEFQSPPASGIYFVRIVLEVPMPADIDPGDAVRLEAGCDRAPETCKNKFIANPVGTTPGNFDNYGGQEDVPGQNRAIEFPDAQ